MPLEGLKLGNQAEFSGDHTSKSGKVEHGPSGIAPAEVVLFEAVNNPSELKAAKARVDHHLDQTLAASRPSEAWGTTPRAGRWPIRWVR